MAVATVRFVRNLSFKTPSLITGDMMQPVLRFVVDHPGAEVLCAAPTMQQLQTTQGRALRLLLDKVGWPGISVSNRPLALKLSNGSRILFRTPSPDGRGVRGMLLHHIWWLGHPNELDDRTQVEFREILRPRRP